MALSIQPLYVQVLNQIKTNDFTTTCKTNEGDEINHFLFVVKSHYSLGQLTEKLNVIKYNGLFFAVDKDGEVKFEVAMNEANEIVKIKDEAFDRIERSI